MPCGPDRSRGRLGLPCHPGERLRAAHRHARAGAGEQLVVHRAGFYLCYLPHPGRMGGCGAGRLRLPDLLAGVPAARYQDGSAGRPLQTLPWISTPATPATPWPTSRAAPWRLRLPPGTGSISPSAPWISAGKGSRRSSPGLRLTRQPLQRICLHQRPGLALCHAGALPARGPGQPHAARAAHPHAVAHPALVPVAHAHPDLHAPPDPDAHQPNPHGDRTADQHP